MKWLLALLFLWPGQALGESIEAGLEQVLGQLDLTGFLDTARQAQSSIDWRGLLISLAKGEQVLSAQGLLEELIARLMNVLAGSLRRMSLLLIPAIVMGVVQALDSDRASDTVKTACHYACYLALAALMAQDLGEHMALCQESMGRMSQAMQNLFPLLLTLLAAVGGTASAAFFQPAVVAASGFMTALITHVTLPLTTAAALMTLLSHLGQRISVSRLGNLLQKAAAWTLGVSFTVFIGVTMIQGLGTAAVDGISIRTAKFAIDNFVPFVGGMFADTVDTLVGCSLLIKNALGVTGLILLAGILAGPMTQTLGAALMYQMCAALLQPVAESRLLKCMADFSRVMMLMFVVQMSLGAMFILLIAQMLVVGNLTVMLR